MVQELKQYFDLGSFLFNSLFCSLNSILSGIQVMVAIEQTKTSLVFKWLWYSGFNTFKNRL
jgi:hypothetical protein